MTEEHTYKGWIVKRRPRGFMAVSPDRSDIRAFNSVIKAHAYIDQEEDNDE